MYNIEDCEEYLLNIPKFKKKTLLSDTLKFYELLGSPGRDIKKIHIDFNKRLEAQNGCNQLDAECGD